MQSTADPVIALSAATLRDLVRRPAFALGVAAILALLAPLPRLGNPAASAADNSALAVELALATVGIVAALVAGACGVQAGTAADGQATPEILTTPCSTVAVAGGRVAGITAAVGALVASVVAGTAALWALVGPFPEIRAPFSVGLSLLGTLLAALAFASFGLFLGACTTRWLAHLLVVGLLVVGRGVPTGGPSTAIDLLASAVTPTARLEVTRDVAFGRAISIAALAFGAAAVLCAAAAAVLGAARRLERREGS